MKKTIIILTITILLLVVGCSDKLTKNKKIAEEFIINSPTYHSDGINLEFVNSTDNKLNYKFDSRSAGYGSRDNSFSASVITPHTIELTILKNKITSSIMDNKWDMINQKMLE